MSNGLKTLHVTLLDDDYNKLSEKKDGLNWIEFLKAIADSDFEVG